MFGAWLVVIGAAWAHVVLERSRPADQGTVEAPARLELWFSGHIEPVLHEVTLVGTPDLALRARVDPQDPTHLVAPLPPLEAGTWTVRYEVVARDGHRVEGQVTFSVR